MIHELPQREPDREGEVKPKVLLHVPTNAIGDAVISTAVRAALQRNNYQAEIISPEHIAPLLNEIDSIHTSNTSLSPGSRIIDINYFPEQSHIQLLPGTQRYGHISEWMGLIVSQQLGMNLEVSPDDVKIKLMRDEIEQARDRLYTLSKETNRLPVVIIVPGASTKNRSLTSMQAEAIASRLKGTATPLLLEPLHDRYSAIDILRVGGNLREAAALLLAADSVVTVDTGPLHITQAGMQGNLEIAQALGISVDPRKLVVALGSSRPEVVAYKGNQAVHASAGCPVSPCGLHGEAALGGIGKFQIPLHVSDDKSACIYPGSKQLETAPCMESVPAGEIVEKVSDYLKIK